MKGLVLVGGADGLIESRARAAGLPVAHGDGAELPWEKTLLVQAGTRVPWDLLPAAWHFLERWDAAVPFWRYGALAESAGTPAEREATRAIVRDLRVMLHAVELLFVRRSEAGAALVAAYAEEMETGGEPRLAFLRALYRVKPRLCALPVTWLAGVRGQTVAPYRRHGRRPAARPLVRLEVGPGHFVRVHAGDEEKVLAQFEQQKNGHRGGQA